MPRKARVEFPGAVYHLLDRGDRQEAIFWIARGLGLGHASSVSRYCSENFNDGNLPKFNL